MEEEAEAGLTNFHKLHNSAKCRSRDRLQRGGGATSLLHIFFLYISLYGLFDCFFTSVL